MQRLAQEQNEEIEKVNRERKYHQVIILFKYFFKKYIFFAVFFLVYGVIWNFLCVDISANHSVRAQRSISRMETALCQEHGDSVCVCCAWDTNRFLEKGSCWKVKKVLLLPLLALLRGCIVSTKLKTLVVEFQGMELRREIRVCQTASIAVRQPPVLAFTDLLKAWIHLSCLRYIFECFVFSNTIYS